MWDSGTLRMWKVEFAGKVDSKDVESRAPMYMIECADLPLVLNFSSGVHMIPLSLSRARALFNTHTPTHFLSL